MMVWKVGGWACHGRLSSASMGRSATIRLPFASVLELNWMSWFLAGGASTSMSSSKSDIVGGHATS